MTADRLIDTFFSAMKRKDFSVLSEIFTADAVYVTRNGVTYSGLNQIQEYYTTLLFEGEIRVWDIRNVMEADAVEWYYEYRFNYAGSISFDGVSLFEITEGKFSRWRDFIQAAKKTYPLESNDVELLQTASRVETCSDWIETLAMHDRKFLGASEKLQGALEELIALLPSHAFNPESALADKE